MITVIITVAICAPIFTTLGYTIAAMLMIGKISEPEKTSKPEKIPKEPTRLFTVGSLVKLKESFYRGTYETERFKEDSDGNTIVLIKNQFIRFEVPIEQLEAVEE